MKRPAILCALLAAGSVLLSCVPPEGATPPRRPVLSELDKRAILARREHHLDFERPRALGYAKTIAFLGREDVVFRLDRVRIGAGNDGLRELEALIALMPAKTLITADHYLICEKNRWSEKIKALRTRTKERHGVTIVCDGAF